MELTFNFIIDAERKPEETDQKYRDNRNGIICYNPSFDLECYINYITLLNDYRDRWKNYGYLDLGMMPLDMAPSFLQDALSDGMAGIANTCGIPIYKMPAVSVLFDRPTVAGYDTWVFKKDVAALMKVPEKEVTLVNFIRWCIK